MKIINSYKHFVLEQLKNGQEVFIPLKGISMEPQFLSGDILTVKKCNIYNVSDIILFHYLDEGYLVHRIIEIKDNARLYLCRGDNTKRIEIILERQILGKVIYAFRKGECIYEA